MGTKIEHKPFQKNPLSVRKIRVRNSGAGNGCANFMDAWKKCVLSAGKPMSIKFRVLGGCFGGGGKCRFYFYGRADFSDFYTEQMDAEGLGRKLPLTPLWRPRRAPEKQTVGAVSTSHKMLALQALSGPVRDTPPYRAIPFRDSIAEGGIAPICLVFIGYRASIAEIPLLRGGYRTSTSHALQGGNAQKGGRGYRTQLAMLRHHPISLR